MGNKFEATIGEANAWQGLAVLCLSPKLRGDVIGKTPDERFDLGVAYTGLAIDRQQFDDAAAELITLLGGTPPGSADAW